jgi:hypothetical protein
MNSKISDQERHQKISICIKLFLKQKFYNFLFFSIMLLGHED